MKTIRKAGISLSSRGLRALAALLFFALALSLAGSATAVGVAAASGDVAAEFQFARNEELEGDVHVYDATPQDPTRPDVYGESDKYGLTANGTAIPVHKYNSNGSGNYHTDVARFASSDSTPEFIVTMKGSDVIRSVSVYPERYYPRDSLSVSEDGKTLTFEMSDKLRYAIVMINGSTRDQAGKPYLAIVNDPKEDPNEIPDRHADNVLDFLTFAENYLSENPVNDVVGDKWINSATVTDHSRNDDELMTWTHDDGYITPYTDAQVQFPNRRARQAYDVSDALSAALLKIKNDPSLDTLYLANGVYFWSGLKISDWNGDPANGGKPLYIYSEEGALMQNRLQQSREVIEAAIYIENSSHITVSGRGVFDGLGAYTHGGRDGKDARNSPHQGGSMLMHSNNITFNDTFLRDAKQWNWECHTVDTVYYNNIKGLSPYNHAWVDGLDLTSGKNVYVNGAFTMGNDDCFAAGHYNPSDEFPRRLYTENRTSEMTGNLMAAAKIFNGDRLFWDTEDTENFVVANTLNYTLNIANGIRLGHNTIGANPAVNGPTGRAMKSYTFDNYNAVNYAGTGLQIQNGNMGSQPKYDSLTFKNCSFTVSGENSGSNLASVPTSTAGGLVIGDVTIENCYFGNPGALMNFQSIANLTIGDLWLEGKLVSYQNQVNARFNNVANLTFTANGEPVKANETPVFTSPESDAYDVYAGNPFSFIVAAADYDDGDRVAMIEADASTMPEGATFDAASGEFYWIPTEADAGKTMRVNFYAYDNGSAAGYYGPAVMTVAATVRSSTQSAVYTYADEETHLQTWQSEKNQNYSARNYLAVALPNQNNGVMGQNLNAGTGDGTDIKIALLKFKVADIEGFTDDERVELELTYMGHRNNVAATDELAINVAAVEDSNWSANTVTWNTRPSIYATDDTVKLSGPLTAGSVINTNAIQNHTGAIDGRKITADVSQFVESAKANGQEYLTLAIQSKTTGKEFYFLNTNGAEGRYAGVNDLSLAPRLAVFKETDMEIRGPAALTLPEGYAATSTNGFTFLAKNQPFSAQKISGDDSIVWNSQKQRFDIAAGLAPGSYEAVVELTDSQGKKIQSAFVLKVDRAEAAVIGVKTPERTPFGEDVSFIFDAKYLHDTNLIEIVYAIEAPFDLGEITPSFAAAGEFETFALEPSPETPAGGAERGKAIIGVKTYKTVSGASELGVLSFRPLKPGDIKVTVESALAYGIDTGDGGFTDSAKRNVVVSPDSAITKVFIKYDVNGDYKVDAADLAIAFYFYMSETGDPNWDRGASLADVDDSGKVDAADLSAIYSNYGDYSDYID